MINIKGQIIKSFTNTFTAVSDGELYELNYRGVFKYKNAKVIVGDFVEFENGMITSVYDRKNSFSRPAVANIDCINIVASVVPEPDFYLIDKLIAQAEINNINTYITVNKCDISLGLKNKIFDNYKNVVDEIFPVSAETGEGIDNLISTIKGRLCAFSGQSAVGKTSIINCAFSLNRAVGDVSEKILRGKNTTTLSEIINEKGCLVIDTPGFSALDCNISSKNLRFGYRDFMKYASDCYYADCLHIKEPDCEVIKAVNSGEISKERYMRYIEIYNNLVKEEKNAKY